MIHATAIRLILPLIILLLLSTGCAGDSSEDTDRPTQTPVDDFSSFLLSMDDLDPSWEDGVPLDRSGVGWIIGNEFMNPPVCAVRADPHESVLQAVSSFQGTGFESHGPYLYHAIATFPAGEAQAFMDEIISITRSCPAEVMLVGSEILQSQADERKTVRGLSVTWGFSLLPFPPLGEQSVAFKRSVHTSVQDAEMDTVLIRQGDVISFLYHHSLGETDTEQTEAAARAADKKLAELSLP